MKKYLALSLLMCTAAYAMNSSMTKYNPTEDPTPAEAVRQQLSHRAARKARKRSEPVTPQVQVPEDLTASTVLAKTLASTAACAAQSAQTLAEQLSALDDQIAQLSKTAQQRALQIAAAEAVLVATTSDEKARADSLNRHRAKTAQLLSDLAQTQEALEVEQAALTEKNTAYLELSNRLSQQQTELAGLKGRTNATTQALEQARTQRAALTPSTLAGLWRMFGY